MRLLRSPLVTACALSLFAGWFAGYWMRPDSEEASGAPTTHTTSKETASLSGDGGPDFIEHSGTPTHVAVEDFDALVRSALAVDDDLDRRVRLRDITRGVALEDMPAVFEGARALPEEHRYEVIYALGSQWGQIDPSAAFDFAIKYNEKQFHGWLLQAALSTWAMKDPDAMAARIEKLPLSDDRSLAFRTLLETVAEHAPRRIMEFVSNQPQRWRDNSHAISQAFYAWSERDPTAAAAAALKLPATSEIRASALQMIASGWAGKDAKGALAWAEQMQEPSTRRTLIEAIATQWVEKDPPAAFAHVLQFTSEHSSRFGVIASITTKWVESDPAAAQAAVLALPLGQCRNEALYGLITGLALEHPETGFEILAKIPAGSQRTEISGAFMEGIKVDRMQVVADLVASLPPGSLRTELTSDLAQRWAEGDISGVLAWVKQLPAGHERSNALARLSYPWARLDPKAATEFLANEKPGSPRDYGVDAALELWCQQAPEEALGWIFKHPADNARDSLVLNAIHVIQANDPARAAQLFTTSLTTATDGNVSGQIAGHWAATDPGAAIKWANELPEGPARERALGSAIGTWAGNDPAAAAAYVQGIGAGAARDAAVESLSNAIWGVDHEGAIAWMATLGQPEQRLNGFISEWLKEDEAAARAWLSRTSLLNTTAKRRFLQRFEHPDGPDEGPQ